MGKIIAFANQKGGVGKTTTAINLAAALSERGKRVLLCDFDPQGNATSGFGVDPRSLETSVYDLIVSEDPDTKSGIVQTKWVDIIGANVNLAGAELDLIAMDHREARLKLVLDKVKDEYDYVFIDCPPSLGLLTLNCLCAADSFLVPLQCEYYALEGLSQLMTTVRMVKKNMNPEAVARGRAADHVRRSNQPVHSGGRGGQKALPGRGILVGRSAQRSSERGAEPRQADHRVRPHVPRRRSVSVARG